MTNPVATELSECPICGPVVVAIAEAEDAHQLLHFLRVKIPHLVGITDEQREQLLRMVDARFAQINAAAAPPAKPRWG